MFGVFFPESSKRKKERKKERRSRSSTLGGTTHSGPGDWKGHERGRDGGELARSYFGKLPHALRRAVRHFNAVS